MQRELVARAVAGDREAFARLVDGSIDRLYAVATLILRDSDRAQDAVQEALIAAWKDIRALRDPDAWNAWLHRLTVRACYRAARRERRRTLVELQLTPEDDPPSPVDAAVMFADRDLVERALGTLSIDHRTVIVLRFHADLAVEDVAAVLGIPAGTVKSRIHRGLAALRAAMAEPPQAPSHPSRQEHPA